MKIKTHIATFAIITLLLSGCVVSQQAFSNKESSCEIKGNLQGDWIGFDSYMKWSFEDDQLIITDANDNKKSEFGYHCFTKNGVKLLDIFPVANENDLFIKNVLSPSHHTLFMIDYNDNELNLSIMDNDELVKRFNENDIDGYNVTHNDYMICHISTDSWDNLFDNTGDLNELFTPLTKLERNNIDN
jgi:hypothetical protein